MHHRPSLPPYSERLLLLRGSVFLSVILALVFGVAPLLAAEPSAHLGSVSGLVAVIDANGQAVQPAGAGASLGAGSRVSTVGRSAATVELPGIGQIELGAGTTLLIRELHTEAGTTVVVVEVVTGAIVTRLAPAADVRLDFRVVDPSEQAVARANAAATFGAARDENGNVTVACQRCESGVLTFPGEKQGLTSGRARTLTARSDVTEQSLGRSIFDALAEGASDDGNSTTPAGQQLPAGQRTGSRDDRRPDDKEDDDPPPVTASGPTARIVSPTNGEAVVGSTVSVRWETTGYTIVPAARSHHPSEVHVHIFLDRDPAPILGTGRPIPLGDPNIVHTANPVVTFQNVGNGTHRVWLVVATGDHVPLNPPVTDTVTFTVTGGAPTFTPTPTVTPTATPTRTATIDQEATIANFVYLPDPIQIRVGQTVRWTNLDADQDGHTVTASDHAWTSPVLHQGETFTRTFTQPGTYLYFCEPHPIMTAFIEVAP